MSGKVIVVTGAASGIGAATARMLTLAGDEVHGLDVRPTPADAGRYLACDIGDPQAIDAAVAGLPGTIDALINVAAVPGPTPEELVMRVNFLGLRHITSRLFGRIAPEGAIVNVASVAGREWQRRAEVVLGLVETADFDAGLEWCRANAGRWAKDPYTFSKQCVTAYSLRTARAAREAGLRCNAVSPGSVETRLSPSFRAQMGAQFDWNNDQMGRQARPEEIAEVIAFVAKGPCGWLNGADIIVDGGLVAGVATGAIDTSGSPAALARAARQAGG